MNFIFQFLFISILSCNYLYAQEKIDSVDLAEEFDHYFYDFFVHVNQHLDVVTVKPLRPDLIWRTSSGPLKHKQKLLNRLIDDMQAVNSVKVDSFTFRMDKEEEMRDYLFKQFFMNQRLATITFDGKAHKVVIYEAEP